MPRELSPRNICLFGCIWNLFTGLLFCAMLLGYQLGKLGPSVPLHMLHRACDRVLGLIVRMPDIGHLGPAFPVGKLVRTMLSQETRGVVGCR